MAQDSGIQPPLFGGLNRETAQPARSEVMEILITVKAAPNPSAKSGETVCVAGPSGIVLRGQPG